MNRLFFTLTLALAAFATSGFGQGNAPAAGINATMLKMFGDIKAFTARAEARLLDEGQKEISAMPMTIALRDNKLRAEMDMSQAKGGAIPAEAAAMLKQVGMDRMITVVRPEKKATVIMYPGLQSYAEVTISDEETADSKVESTELANEMIDGHQCKKTRLTSTDAKGNKQEALVWQATDLKNFPLQMQMVQKGNTLIVKYQAPKLETPEASLFDIPAGYKKYPNVQALMQAAMMKMLGGLEMK
jgi:hypothetical protein